MRSLYNYKQLLIYLIPVILLQCADSQRLTESVRIVRGAVNGVEVKRNGSTLVIYGDPDNKIRKADIVLFTHFRRDVIWAGRNLTEHGSHAVVPDKEIIYFTGCDSIWTKAFQTRFHDYYCQTSKISFIPQKVYRAVKGGEILTWQDIDIKVLDTPGYTRGSVTYIMDIDGKRFAFTGDLIYNEGKIPDLYSFQDSLQSIGGYHGYATRLGQLVSSLQLIAGEKPDIIIPARGPIITNPDASIRELIRKIRSVYQNYLSISAYRWYFPERMALLANHVPGPDAHVDWMPFAVTEKKPPAWYIHINNSNLVFADDSSAFLIDCGVTGTFKRLVALKQSGRLKSLDGVFITHYHDDHTNNINDVLKEFDCPVYATRELEDILGNPGAYDLPCLTTESIKDLNIMQDGQRILWKDFTLTFRFFPGQTLYHDALLFEKSNGETIFFIGDSFTPSGIDDYCLLNRNFLHQGSGYFYCLDILKNLPGNVLLSNQHVEPLFSFSKQQLDHMTNMLKERTIIMKDLFPWDNINFGIDEQWVRIYPYAQKTNSGATVELSVKIFNHSDVVNTYHIKPDVPAGFDPKPASSSLEIQPRTEGEQVFEIRIPKKIPAGLFMVSADISTGNWDLRRWSEAMIEVVQ
ncbi:MAG TPA: hypothetical protein DDW27_00350 [Bacteroidales bacterium]|nr:hypothetical protein [Bacteroidales bacterium]